MEKVHLKGTHQCRLVGYRIVNCDVDCTSESIQLNLDV